jgi:pimeloyl-ACP methyl ester carboxylesterase
VLERASLTRGQRLLRGPLGPIAGPLMNERLFRRQFASLFSAAHPLTDEEAADQWSLIAHGGGRRIAHRLMHYLDERVRLAERWHGAVRDWPGSLSLAWGLQDPVATAAVLDALRELRPGVPVTELPDLGHYPQVEDPARIGRLIGAAIGTLT